MLNYSAIQFSIDSPWMRVFLQFTCPFSNHCSNFLSERVSFLEISTLTFAIVHFVISSWSFWFRNLFSFSAVYVLQKDRLKESVISITVKSRVNKVSHCLFCNTYYETLFQGVSVKVTYLRVQSETVHLQHPGGLYTPCTVHLVV